MPIPKYMKGSVSWKSEGGAFLREYKEFLGKNFEDWKEP